MNYFIYILIITLLFLIYVELSVGGIVYRVNASGKKNIYQYIVLQRRVPLSVLPSQKNNIYQ